MRTLSFLLIVLTLSGCAGVGGFPAHRHNRPVYNYSLPQTQQQPQQEGIPVYGADQCIGAIVNGVCHGSIMPNGGTPMICHGGMINGMCTGPMF